MIFACLFGVACAAPGTLRADETGPAAKSPARDTRVVPNDDKATSLDPIVVSRPGENGYGPVDDYKANRSATGTKTDTPLIETPQSISVITRKEMEDQGVESLGEALRYTPGVQGEPFGVDQRLTFLRLRGFDVTTSGLFRDGLQLQNPGFGVSYNLEPFGAERIEVLRGPASVLYGQGSPGGLINYVSKLPTQRRFANIEFDVGNFSLYQGRFDLGGRIDTLGEFSFRLTGLVRDSNTQVDFTQNDRIFLAPAFTWRPSDNTSLTFLVNYQRDRTKTSQALPAAGTLDPNPHGSLQPNLFTGEPDVDKYDRDQFSFGYLFEHRFNPAWSFRQHLRYYTVDLDTVMVYSTFLQPDLRTLDRAAYSLAGRLKGFAVDNRAQYKFSTWSVRHQLLMGFDYQRVSVSGRKAFAAAPSLDIFDPVYGAAIPDLPVFFDQDTAQSQYGLYLQDQIKIGKRLILSLGGRYDWVRAHTTDHLAGTKISQSDQEFTFRGGIVYRFDFGLAPYFSYSQSFLPVPGTNLAGEPFKPERGEQFEVGVKYQPTGYNSFVTLALFNVRRQNVLTDDPATPLDQVQTGEIRSRGLEISGVASLGFGLDLILSYTFMDVKITKSNVPGEKGQWPTQTPAHMASFWAKYTVPSGPLKGLSLGGGVRYLGGGYADIPNTVKSPAAVVGDLMVAYRYRSFRFALNVKNVSDNEFIASCFERTAQTFCTFGQRRTIIGSVRYRW